MVGINSGGRRQRRLLTRAIPLGALAAGAFLVGALLGGGPSGLAGGQRFADSLERGDFAGMYAELTADSKQRYAPEAFANAYRRADDVATVSSIDAGEADAGDRDHGEEAVAPLTLRTRAFGTITRDLRLPLDEEQVAWSPNLVFPGLRAGEHLERSTRMPRRAAILARDGMPLAEGPAGARTSPLGVAAQSVVGATAAPKGEAEQRLFARGVPPHTPVGTTGLELAFDGRLAGRPGGRLLAAGGGSGTHVLASSDPVPGKPVHTTIDPLLQRTAVASLGAQYGGVAVLDPKDGSVRALAGIAFSGPQPPGSTFKIITTTAALEAGAVKLTDQFPIQTSSTVGGREIANASGEACGGTFVEAFAESCNSVFVPLGPKLGSDRLVGTAERFGFNSTPTLYDDRATSLTRPKRSTLPESIPSDVDLGVTAIGQGQVLATPLEMASVAQTIANGGVRAPTPIVTDPSLKADAKPVKVTSPDIAHTLRDLMIGVVTNGTGTAAAIPGVQVAGKTGTAELGPVDVSPGQKVTETAQRVDAWFTSFAPAGDPKIVVAVMIVNASGAGGDVAAPIARDVLAAGLGSG